MTELEQNRIFDISYEMREARGNARRRLTRRYPRPRESRRIRRRPS